MLIRYELPADRNFASPPRELVLNSSRLETGRLRTASGPFFVERFRVKSVSVRVKFRRRDREVLTRRNLDP